jgi:uncharacterized protein (DUF2141 family)
MFTRRIATLAAALLAAITFAGATAGAAGASTVHHSVFRTGTVHHSVFRTAAGSSLTSPDFFR